MTTPTEALARVKKQLNKGHLPICAPNSWGKKVCECGLSEALTLLPIIEGAIVPDNWDKELYSITICPQTSGGFYVFEDRIPKGVFGETLNAAILAAIEKVKP